VLLSSLKLCLKEIIQNQVWIAVAIIATVHRIRLNWEAGKLKAMKSLAYNSLAVHISAMSTILAGILVQCFGTINHTFYQMKLSKIATL
jgi:hypothetical protein